MKVIIVFIVAVAFMYADHAIGDDAFVDTERERIEMIDELKENWPQRMNEYLATLSPLTIQGMVLDQNNDPVPGAEIDIHWQYFDEHEFYKINIGSQIITTNGDGLFTFTKEKILELTMWDVKRKGYEFNRELSQYYQSNSDMEAMQENSVNEPIVIKMRKLNPTTFLLQSDVTHYFKEPSAILRYTMIPGLLLKMDPDPGKLTKPEQNDLIFTVNQTDNGSYTVHIQPIPQIGGSMQVLDEYLYEAPAEGYLPEVTLTIRPEDGVEKKYLYFISRKTPVYSRMTMELKADATDHELEFSSSTWTNPYGKRNLEGEPELPSRLETKLFLEAEKALNNGTRPPEPENLQALIEQYTSN